MKAAVAAAASRVNGANRAGNASAGVSIQAGQPAHKFCRHIKETAIETFKKRQKEMRRLDRQRDKAAKRKEIKAGKANGLGSGLETETGTVTTENAAASDPAAVRSTVD